MPDDFVSKELAKSHKVLDSAHKFQSSAGGPLHQFSNTPYSIARSANKSGASTSGSTTTGAELKAKSSNVDNYVKNVAGQ